MAAETTPEIFSHIYTPLRPSVPRRHPRRCISRALRSGFVRI